MSNHMSKRHRSRWFTGAILAGLLGAVLMTATPAYAIDTYAESNCYRDGFEGRIRVHYSYSPGSGAMTVRYYSYRISKGPNRGGNSANIYITDNGIMPSRSYSTTSGIQDNAYHVLADPANYSRASSGYFNYRFVFDKSFAWPDPECTGSFRVPSTY